MYNTKLPKASKSLFSMAQNELIQEDWMWPTDSDIYIYIYILLPNITLAQKIVFKLNFPSKEDKISATTIF